MNKLPLLIFQFCRKATRLQQCKARQMAYISISTVDKETETYRTRTEKLLCRCSENYYYQYHDMKVMDVDTETRVEEFLYKCLPVCNTQNSFVISWLFLSFFFFPCIKNRFLLFSRGYPLSATGVHFGTRMCRTILPRMRHFHYTWPSSHKV